MNILKEENYSKCYDVCELPTVALLQYGGTYDGTGPMEGLCMETEKEEPHGELMK